MDFPTIKLGLYTWASTESNLEVIWMDQNGPKPENPYFGMRMNSFEKIHEDYIAPPNSSGISQVIGNDEFILEIYGFGPGIVASTETLKKTLDLPRVQKVLNDSKLIFVESLSIQNLSGLDSSRFEERSSFDIRFRTWTEQSDNSIGLIETIEAEGTLESPDKPDIIQEISVTKP